MNTLVLLDGGHTTLVKNINPSELETDITEAREAGISLLYLRDSKAAPHDYPDGVVNRVAVDPAKVVAVITNESN